MSHDVAAILADTHRFGFEFQLEMVKRDDIKYPNTPVMVVTDLAEFDNHFPGVALESLNGQSVRVNSQRIGRDARVKGIHDSEEIKAKNINWLIGIRVVSSRTVTVYAGQRAA